MINDKESFPVFNRIFLKDIGFIKYGKERYGKGKIFAKDLSSFPFIIEELISFGAVDIAINKYALPNDYLKKIPSSLRKRICRVDTMKTYKKVDVIFEPIAEEFKIEEFGYSHIKFHKSLMDSPKLQDALGRFYFGLADFLIGLENELQIEINLKNIKDSISMLRESSKNPSSRANLAILLGIFNTYRPNKINALALKSYAPERLISLFKEFVEDETYRKLSHQAYLLGFPVFLNRAKTQIARLVKKIAKKSQLKKFINIATKSITVATEVPIPSADIMELLLNKEFLPPIISYRDAWHKAYERWKLVKPEFQGYPSLKNRDIEWANEFEK